MKSEESILTDFNLYFVTFPRQTYVKIIDCKMPLDMAKEFNTIDDFDVYEANEAFAAQSSCSPNPMV